MTTTSALSWRQAREEGIEISLPSGNTVALRPVEVDFFVAHGHIPDSLASKITEMINGTLGTTNEIPASEKVEQSKEWLTFLDELCAYAFVKPRITDVPLVGREVSTPQGDFELSIEDVTYYDKLAVYRLFGYPAHVLRTFRQQQINVVAPVATVADERAATIEDAETEPVGTADKSSRNARHVDRVAV